jgi:hypothetical protein
MAAIQRRPHEVDFCVVCGQGSRQLPEAGMNNKLNDKERRYLARVK